MSTNPFYELYLAETMSANEFVSLFSPALLAHVQPLFLPGNVVVVGMQGSGKSMLLTLLKAETRLKYEQVNSDFPVSIERRNFISCAVNLAHSNSVDFGYRDWVDDDPREVEMLFGDFVNSLLCYDLFNSLDHLIDRASDELLSEIGVSRDRSRLDALAKNARSMWNGWFSNVDDWSSLQKRLSSRIALYRGFLHRRHKELSQELRETKTSIGEPIGEFAEMLRGAQAISSRTNVFVDIDQYEELGNIRTGPRNSLAVDYRGVINRALARRDPRISYRIGSRRHSWRSHSRIMGSEGRLEEERDYKFVDLDLLLKRGEDQKTYIFPSFAADVFQRRMRVAKVASDEGKLTPLDIYGAPTPPPQKAKYYQPKPKGGKLPSKAAAGYPAEWRPSTRARLERLVINHPLSAKLGEAWIRQKGEVDDLDVRDEMLPWERKTYWKKERIEVALLQMASANQQRPIYSGDEEIYDLSNGNILIFISINQHIWDQYIRFASKRSDLSHDTPVVGRDLQSAGIFRASEHWYNKISEETGRSTERLSFLSEMARVLREKITGDKKLSYPGASGFSMKEAELNEFPQLKAFLEELADYGNLSMLQHTTKDKDKATRLKWYISPILCPFLKLPYKRVKEPYYASVKELFSWLAKAKVTHVSVPSHVSANQADRQAALF